MSNIKWVRNRKRKKKVQDLRKRKWVLNMKTENEYAPNANQTVFLQ